MSSATKTLSKIVLVGLLAGCTALSPDFEVTGKSRTEILARLGSPMRSTPLPDGERLDYSRGPDGLNTYFIYLDREGKATRVEQVLSEANFSRIKAGMSQGEVIDILGDPPKRRIIARERGYVWSYRSFSTMCIWFQIEFAPDDIVRSAGFNRRPAGIPCR